MRPGVWSTVFSVANHPPQRRVSLWRFFGLAAVFTAALFIFVAVQTPQEMKGRKTQQRVIKWSGYDWWVRASGNGLPGPMNWSNGEQTVKVVGKELQLSIVKQGDKWYSGQVESLRNLGYGTYKWTIASDLSDLDPYEVLG